MEFGTLPGAPTAELPDPRRDDSRRREIPAYAGMTVLAGATVLARATVLAGATVLARATVLAGATVADG